MSFDAKQISTLAWAYARAGRWTGSPSGQLWCSKSTSGVSHAVSRRSLYQIVAFFAKPEHKRRAVRTSLIRAAAAAMALGMNEFTDQGLANLAWSCARTPRRGSKAEALVQSVTRAASDRLDEFGPQACANLLWAAATCDSAQDLDVSKSRHH